ncbi:amino acid transporter [Anaeramoeba flamelloides]|uniref:Amino acid transporter n=1 Tax=Anaeramoeba flamelloides TaxID=1746091 RepID=A0ABQ8XXL0_9EUKA|nr:amino acid transporter [Anaeramoeba flamelloides]
MSEEESQNSGKQTDPLLSDKNNKKCEQNSTIWGATFTLSNTLLGAATLSVPYAFRAGGMIMSLIIMVCSGALSFYSMHLLVKSTEISKRASYKGVSEAAFHKKGSIAVVATICVFIFGVVTTYFCFIADLVTPIFRQAFHNTSYADSFLTDRRFLMPVTVIITVFPLSFFKQITKLNFPSLLVILALMFVMIQTVVHSVDHMIKHGIESSKIKYFSFHSEILLAIPILSLAFLCQFNVFTVLKELKNNTPRRKHIVILNAVLSGIFFYTLIGIFGYLNFYDNTKGVILNNYSDDNVTAIIGRIAMIVALIFSTPVVFYAGKESLHSLLFKDKPMEGKTAIGVAFSLFTCSVILAIFVPDVVGIFTVTGSIGGNLVVYILPSLFYLKLRSDHLKKQKQTNFSVQNGSDTDPLKKILSDDPFSDEKSIDETEENRNENEKENQSENENENEEEDEDMDENNNQDQDDFGLHSKKNIQTDLKLDNPIYSWILLIYGIVSGIICCIESVKDLIHPVTK